jgi:hypothetical protein
MFIVIRAEEPVRIFGAKNAVGLELFSLCITSTSAYCVLVMKNGVYNFAFSFQNDCRFMNQAVLVSHPTYCLRDTGVCKSLVTTFVHRRLMRVGL